MKFAKITVLLSHSLSLAECSLAIQKGNEVLAEVRYGAIAVACHLSIC